MTSTDEPGTAQVRPRPEQSPDYAFALSLIQVHENKIRALLNSKLRRYIHFPRFLLSRVTHGKAGALQSFDEYMKVARRRAGRMVDSRLGTFTDQVPAQRSAPEPQQIEALALAAKRSPLHQLFLQERARHDAPDATGSPPDFHDVLKAAAERALSRSRPGQPRNVLVFTSHVLDNDEFRARVKTSRQHAALLEAQPLVSVIMPTHNRAALLASAVASVLQQTYPHLELLIIDDHSTDETRQVCEALAASDPRVRYIHSAGKGVSSARNAGLAHSRGEFIAYLDDDNTWSADYLELMLTHMRIEGADFAYASMRLTDQNGTVRFRGRHFNHADLLIQNYIDMNIAVHTRELVDKSGPFDEALERAVDWEFIIRATRSARVSWAEFIGADYSDDATRTDRLTVAKRYAWRFHVMNRHWIDWAETPVGRPLPFTVLVNAHGNLDDVEETLAEVLRNTPADLFELVVIDNHLDEDEIARIHLWAELIPNLRVVHTPQHFGLALGYNAGVQFARGDVLAFVALGIRLRPGWLEKLAEELDKDAIGLVQPVLTNASGSVHSAGFRWDRPGPDGPQLVRSLPGKLHGGAQSVSAASSECIVIRRADFVALRGFEPLFTGDLGDIDLSFRVRSRLGKSCVAATGVSVVYDPRKRIATDLTDDTKGYFDRLWREPARALAQADGLELRGEPKGRAFSWLGGKDASGAGGGDQPPRKLQFAIKICCPSESVKLQWGDYHFAFSLAKEINKLGHACRIDMAPNWNDEGLKEDVVIVLRGLYRYKPKPDAVNFMWLISHPQRVKPEELIGFDHIFVASKIIAGQLAAETSVPISVMLQCTDPDIFYPSPEMAVGDRIIFVGNSRNVKRPVVVAASEEGLPAEIYGGGWDGFCRPEMVKAGSVTNQEVGDLYRSAGLVLNDHWQDMQLNGFVSNRLFDACACAAPVISDFVAGLEVFEDLVSVLPPEQPLGPLVRRVLDEAPALRSRRVALAQRIIAEHSFATRAKEIVAKTNQIVSVRV
jgi:glycosyltransferase involved in cell wall biosynthesis